MDKQTLHVEVHREPAGYWATVSGLDGCFASGETIDELLHGLNEAISLYVGDEEPARLLTRVTGLTIDVEPDLRASPEPPYRPPSVRQRPPHPRDDWPPR